MDRRKFLGLFSAGVAGIALEQAIPLGRLWSFPKKIVIAKPALSQFDYVQNYNRALRVYALEIGDIVTIKSSLHFPGYIGPFIITDVHESAAGLSFDLKAPRHHIAGTAPRSALDPFPTAAFPPDSSHRPS